MQMYETGLAALVILGAVSVLVLRPKDWMAWVYVVATGYVLWLHLHREGPHWQVFPLYLAVAVILGVQFAVLGDRKGGQSVRVGAWAALTLCVLSVACSYTLPMFKLPAPTGPYAVGTYSEVLWSPYRNLDAPPDSLKSNLPIRIWYPAEPGTGSPARYTNPREVSPLRSYEAMIRTNSRGSATPILSQAFPVLLFGPKWGGSRVQDTFLAEDLASNGYIVVAIDHPRNAALADIGKRVIKSDRADAVSIAPVTTADGVKAVWSNELAQWIKDDEVVMRYLTEFVITGAPFGRPDMTRVGAFGHSFGGASSMALLGVDPRVRCAVNLDGWIFQGLDHRTTQPVLLVYEGVSEVRHPESGVEGELDRADDAAVDGNLERYGGLRAYVAGTQHLDFTDQTLLSPFQRLTYTGPIQGERIRTITRGLVLGFFDQNLKGSGEIPGYPEVHMHRYFAPE